MGYVEMRCLDSLEKIRLTDRELPEAIREMEGFEEEVLSFQVALRLSQMIRPFPVHPQVVCDGDAEVTVRRVMHVPVTLCSYPGARHMIGMEPGLYPDLLKNVDAPVLLTDSWQTLWITVRGHRQGRFFIGIRILGENGERLAEESMPLTILPGILPDISFIQTRWMHYDSIAQACGLDMLSEPWWGMLERYVRSAVEMGVNMILTPIHTPPLDTRVGGERETVQLVKVIRKADGSFEMDARDLRRFVRLCLRSGIRYFEMAHLFTQWGAASAPKIMGWEEGKEKRLFGWETSAGDPEYRRFLEVYIPFVRRVMQEEGVGDRVFWHVSDEPGEDHREAYRKARGVVEDLLEGDPVMDAISDPAYQKENLTGIPVVATTAMKDFRDLPVQNMFAYYCCGQWEKVQNQFIAMESSASRTLALTLYRYDIHGFLQWGFNFYQTQYSDASVNPFLVTDGNGWVPAGDPFVVYPGRIGPEESIRYQIHREWMQDLKALKWLEKLAGRAFVLECVESCCSREITWESWPESPGEILSLRARVNQEIVRRTGKQTSSPEIRLAEADDLQEIMEIYGAARAFMADHGNPRQWGGTCWPPQDLIREDIARRKLYVCEEGKRILAVFFYHEGAEAEPGYAGIEQGRWVSMEPYGVVHRIAVRDHGRGIGRFCLSWAFERCGHLKIDTHPDNAVMQRLLEKMGFERRGIIHVAEDRDERYAYEKIRGTK